MSRDFFEATGEALNFVAAVYGEWLVHRAHRRVVRHAKRVFRQVRAETPNIDLINAGLVFAGLGLTNEEIYEVFHS